MNKQNLIIKIASILLKQEVPHWRWEVANSALKARYLEQAEDLYEIFVNEEVLINQKE